MGADENKIVIKAIAFHFFPIFFRPDQNVFHVELLSLSEVEHRLSMA